MELYPFNALLARMKYISRWGLMRVVPHGIPQRAHGGRRHSGAHAVP